jgi:hypothetical protein
MPGKLPDKLAEIGLTEQMRKVIILFKGISVSGV